ncbi:MAG: gliding motility-associated C-terminal domain-containing protein [Bacteroidia bacterium]|nr:gliding motility-associated C-terminal domain-containing protein [Bacteroidia bacterium]
MKMVAVGNGYIYNREEKIMKGSQFLESAPYSLINGFVYPESKDSIVIFHDIVTQSPYRHYWGYSIVDLSKDSGRGEVIARNIVVRKRPNPNLAIVQHKNGIDFWVLGTNDSVNAFVYKFTSLGLDTVPVKSTGTFNNYVDANSNLDYSNLSVCFAPFIPTWDSKQIIVTGLTKSLNSTAMALLYDFDNNTGKITNPQVLFKRTNVTQSNYTTQKAAISFNDSFVYFGVMLPNHGGIGEMAYFFQINRFTKNRTLLRTHNISNPYAAYGFWGTTLGPDGKILVQDFSNLKQFNPIGDFWRVERPNEAGVKCQYRKWCPDSIGGLVWTLPTTILKSTPPYFIVNSNSNSCNDTTVFTINGDTALNKLVLHFGDGDTILYTGPFKKDLKFRHFYKSDSSYPVSMVTWDKYCNTPKWLTDTILVYKPPQNFSVKVDHSPSCADDTVIVAIKAKNHTRFTANWGLSKPSGGFYDTVVNSIADSQIFRFVYPETKEKFQTVYSVSNSHCALSISDSIVILVFPKPESIHSFIEDTVCGNEVLNLVDSSNQWRQLIVNWPTQKDTIQGSGVLNFSSKAPNNILIEKLRIHLIATNFEGCKSIDSLFVTIKPKPIAELFVEDSIICASQQSVIIKGKKLNNPIGTKWSIADGFETKWDSNWNKSYHIHGNYEVKFIGASNFGCTDTTVVHFQVVALPNAGFNANSDSICSRKETLQLTNTASSFSDSIKAIWYINGIGDTTLNKTDFTTIYRNPGNYNLTQLVFTNQGCIDSFKKAITVKQTPITSFNLSQSLLCAGADLFATSDSTESNDWGKWSIPLIGLNEMVSGALGKPQLHFSSSATKSLSGTYQILFELTNNVGCADTTEKSVVIFKNPTADFIVPKVCQNQPALFSSTSKNGSASIKEWKWLDKLTNKLTYGEILNFITSRADTFEFTHTVIDTNNCMDSISKIAIVNRTPNPSITWSPFKLQDPTNYQYIFTAEPSEMQKYSWDFEGAGKYEGKVVFPTFLNVKDSLFVSLEVTSNNSCSSDTSIYFEVYGLTGFYFPSAITRNNDGLNEGFGISGPEFIKKYSLLVFNKWGEKVFETNNPYEMWIPEKALIGQYVFYAEIQDLYNRNKKVSGTVFLLR